jgi:hypothetical protein
LKFLPANLKFLNPLGNKKLANLLGATQYKNVFNQLNMGIRLIDIRFCIYGGNQWRICHGNFGPYLHDILNQIKEFLNTAGNEKEVIYVKIRNFDDGAAYESWKNGTLLGHTFMENVDAVIGGHINKNWNIESTLEEIVKSGQRVLLIGGKLEDRSDIKVDTSNEFISTLYPNKDNYAEIVFHITTGHQFSLKNEFGKKLTMIEYQLTLGPGVATLKHYSKL